MTIEEIRKNAPDGATYYTSSRVDHPYLIKSKIDGRWCGLFKGQYSSSWLPLVDQNVGYPIDISKPLN